MRPFWHCALCPGWACIKEAVFLLLFCVCSPESYCLGSLFEWKGPAGWWGGLCLAATLCYVPEPGAPWFPCPPLHSFTGWPACWQPPQPGLGELPQRVVAWEAGGRVGLLFYSGLKSETIILPGRVGSSVKSFFVYSGFRHLSVFLLLARKCLFSFLRGQSLQLPQEKLTWKIPLLK